MGDHLLMKLWRDIKQIFIKQQFQLYQIHDRRQVRQSKRQAIIAGTKHRVENFFRRKCQRGQRLPYARSTCEAKVRQKKVWYQPRWRIPPFACFLYSNDSPPPPRQGISSLTPLILYLRTMLYFSINFLISRLTDILQVIESQSRVPPMTAFLSTHFWYQYTFAWFLSSLYGNSLDL